MAHTAHSTEGTPMPHWASHQRVLGITLCCSPSSAPAQPHQQSPKLKPSPRVRMAAPALQQLQTHEDGGSL